MAGYNLNQYRKGSGFIVDFLEGGETVTEYSLVYLDANSQWVLADASAAASMPVVGLATQNMSRDQKGRVVLIGTVGTNDWAWTPGDAVYVGSTAGELTQVEPGAGELSQVIGYAINATTIIFNPSGYGVFIDEEILGVLNVDTINESTLDAGVTVEGVLLKDNDVDISGILTVDTINEHTADDGVTIEGVVLEDNTVLVPGLTASRLVASDGSKILVSTDADSWITGTANEITVTDNGDGTVTLDIPDAVTLTNLTVTDITIGANTVDTNEWANLDGLDQGVASTDDVTFNDLDLTGDATIDTVDEHTGDAGVTIESVLLKDGEINVDTIDESTGSAGVTVEDVLLKDGDVRAEGQVYGVEWNQTTDTWTQIDINGDTITPSASDFNNHAVWGNMTRVNLAPDGTVNARYGDGDYASDGSNGEVMVEIPCFYVRGEQLTTGVYQWWISRVPLEGFEIHPAFLQRDGRPKPYIYVGAYEASLLVGTGAHDDDTTLKLTHLTGEQPWTGDEIDALPYDSGSTEFTRGETLTGATGGATADVVDWTLTSGTWGGGDAAGTVYIKQEDGTDFQAEDLNGSTGGANMASATGVQVAESLTIGDARGYAEAIEDGWGLMSIWSLSAVKLLFVVEYGNMDSQSEVGRGVVDLASGSGFAGVETGADDVDNQLDSALTGSGTGADGETPIVYRGIENLWGNVWAFIDGYNAVDEEYRIISRHGRDTFEDSLTDYEASSMAPITTDGYISDIEWDRVMKYLFIASETSGDASTYIPDYQYSHDTGEENILLAGGSWNSSSHAGLGGLRSYNVASASLRGVGARGEYNP